MKITQQIAKHLREVYFGGNWTYGSLKDALVDVDWEMTRQQVYDFNTIGILLFHINYYINAILKVLNGEPLDSNDKYAFEKPAINSTEDWQTFKEKIFEEAEQLAAKLETLDDDILAKLMADEKYGIYYRNLHGIIEHCHYHIGQIVLIKKIILADRLKQS